MVDGPLVTAGEGVDRRLPVAECQAAPEQADHQFVPDVVGQD